jgi:hypothetical protein
MSVLPQCIDSHFIYIIKIFNNSRINDDVTSNVLINSYAVITNGIIKYI